MAENVEMGQLTHEEKITSDVIGQWYDWMLESGTKIKISSPINPAPDRIERVII